MKYLIVLVIICCPFFFALGQDIVSGGTNSWILHTPDDGRKTLYLAPKKDEGGWDFGVQTQFLNTGQIVPGLGITLNKGNLKQTGAFDITTQGSVKLKNYLLFDSDGDFTGGNYFSIQDHSENNYLRFGYGFNDQLVIKSNGDIGIGKNNPNSELDVTGTISFSSRLYKSSNSPGLTDPTLLSAQSEHSIDFGGGELPIITLGFEQGISSGTDMDTKIWSYARKLSETRNFITVGRSRIDLSAQKIYTNAMVGIGTKDYSGVHKLRVEGSIGAREIKVEAFPNWSDFVFEENYDLPTLGEVEEHIKVNGHLKDIPSAEEVKEDGIYLGQMDAKLLQKIEELTLYMIDMNKEIKAVKNENALLKEKVKLLEEQ